MDKFDRLQILHRTLSERRLPVPIRELAKRMFCTEKTVKRTIDLLRDYFHAPIEYCSKHKGWYYATKDTETVQLPGLWLTAEELQSLILLLQVLQGFGNGLLNEELHVVQQQIHKMMQARGIPPNVFIERIKALPIAGKPVPGKIFLDIGETLVKQQQIKIRYTDSKNRPSNRTISPQNLVYYRDNWYIDAWCHLREDLRTFSLARITRIDKDIDSKPRPAKSVDSQTLHEHFATSYGIFAGKAKHIAKLRFLPAIAREIAMQQWHPAQKGTWDGDDYLLEIPYSKDLELISDILRHTPNVVVQGPAGLKKAVVSRLRAGLELY